MPTFTSMFVSFVCLTNCRRRLIGRKRIAIRCSASDDGTRSCPTLRAGNDRLRTFEYKHRIRIQSINRRDAKWQTSLVLVGRAVGAGRRRAHTSRHQVRRLTCHACRSLFRLVGWLVGFIDSVSCPCRSPYEIASFKYAVFRYSFNVWRTGLESFVVALANASSCVPVPHFSLSL